jgi:YbbR domain-containing protein
VDHKPVNSYLLRPDPLPGVTSIRYIAAADVRVSTGSFRASIDLTNVTVSSSQNSLVGVQLVALDPRIQVIGYEPQQIRVSLDPIVSKSVDVKVEISAMPSGLTKGNQTLSQGQVLAIGPESFVSKVSVAQAPVSVDTSGLDVSKDVSLVPIDAQGRAVENVTLSPTSIHVGIQIGSELRTESVAVAPVIKGSPASGFYVSSIDVSPLVVTVSGDANALATLNGRVNTQPISISGATGDVSVKVALDLPSTIEARDVSTVTVTVHLTSPAATRTISIGVVLEGARADRIYGLSTPSVTITIGGASAALNAFDTSTLFGSVQVGELTPGTHTLKVTVSVPPGIKVVSINPAQITVTVTVPPSPSPSPSPTG